ncbi:RNA polymerase II-associated protein 1 [Anopheles merus]|uniref:RNA polymerase II-associated protein 1 N-terminal domain-containing protein n=1 Tax=Anopheles merus TaxID=30066 RepID=A0A182V5P0_ANOME|nr:RNA polymerase II-associated protein 1 [Anopheles merus]
MIKRPSKKDSENEILRMQQEFYAEQNRDANFQPAAKVVRVQRDGETPAASSSSSSAGGTVRQSEFAKRRAQRLQAQQATTPATAAENMATDDEAEAPTEEQPPPSTESLVMGEVVERKPEQTFAADVVPSTVEGSFPKTMHITAYPVKSQADGPRKSIFAQMISKGKTAQPQKIEAVESKDKIEFEEPSGSALLEGWDATEIHNENLRKLNQMSIEEISKERSHLLNTLDPKLVEFLKARRKPTAAGAAPVAKEPALSEKAKEKCKPVANPGLLPAGMEVLKEKGSEQWINFDVLEPEKLEWTKDIERSVKELKPGESYEARFDWKGVLQPYVANTNPQQMDDRELYLHGEDAQRPGYTLQELFRLARSNVLQQRISALGAIAGMLNILNQGFYDGVLELPVSKVFFFLRFALDENTPSVVEVASRALASLFYNDTDEILLDTVFDTEYGMVQPELALNITHSHEEKRRQREQEMAAGFGAMNLSGGKASRPPRKAHFKAHLPDPDDPDDVHNRETMNDFHLAETDLMECLVRTNILERIRYILFAMKPEGATVINCTKILIRLARTSEQMALKIATNEALIGGLVKNYLTSIESPEREHQPQHVVLKLVRVLCGYGAHFYDLYLNRFHVVQLAKRYVFSRKDIDMRMIQVQIEAFRFFRLLLNCKPDDELYSDLWPALCYLLQWHYQHLIFDESGPFIIRQHAVALLALIGPGLQRDAVCSRGDASSLGEKLFACCSKWFTAAERNGANEFSQKILLAGCLWMVGRARAAVGMEAYRTFRAKYLAPFVRSSRFREIIQTISSSSLLLTHFEDRSQYGIESLPTLGAVQVRRNQTVPTLIVTSSYPVFLLHALLHLTGQKKEELEEVDTRMREDIFGSASPHRSYLEAVCRRTRNAEQQQSLIGNWFVQTIEQRYLHDVLEFGSVDSPAMESENGAVRSCRLQLAFFLTFSLSEAFYPAIVKLFDDFIFKLDYYGCRAAELAVTGADMQRWKFNYKLLTQRAIQNEVNLAPARAGLTAAEWKTPLLRRTWPYSPLYLLVEKLEKGPAHRLEQLTETAIIGSALRFSELLERAGGIAIASPTERLMYLMAAFLGPDSKFLEPDLSALIERRLAELRTIAGKEAAQRTVFEFETAKMENRKSYYGLYQLALDTFQSSSYGHGGFGCLLMVPLAQRYDVRWRNMVWSEYVAVLRFITCGERELFGTLEEYLEPAETDIVLLRSYGQALNSNLLRPGSIPHRVANHHVQVYRSKVKVMPEQEQQQQQDNGSSNSSSR